jgi:phage gpG-like protein
VNFFTDSFKKQGWEDESFEPWKKRKKETNKTKGRAILIETSKMMRSIHIGSTEQNRVTVVNDDPKARIHNYGGTITQAPRSETFQRNRLKRGANKGRFKKGTKAGKGFTFKARKITIPQRKFMGRSQALVQRLKEAGRTHLLKALQ